MFCSKIITPLEEEHNDDEEHMAMDDIHTIDTYECNRKTGEIIYDEKTGEPKPRTAHSLNPVFAYVYEPTGSIGRKLSELEELGISSLAVWSL